MSDNKYDDSVEFERDLSQCIVIDNIPVVGAEKYKKLCEVIAKRFSAFGNILPDGVYVPVDDTTEETVGFAFIEYESANDAQQAIQQGDGMKLDKRHTFQVTSLEDYDKIVSLKDEYVPPKRTDQVVDENLQEWLLDSSGRDEFLLRYADETVIYWNDPRLYEQKGRKVDYDGKLQKAEGKKWTDSATQWSSQGSYLATFHRPGIVLWGGKSYRKLHRFNHLGVKKIDFSPCERYLITYNGQGADALIVWDIATGKKLRDFDKASMEGTEWPIFKWSFDGQYLAKRSPDTISVYKTPEMNLLDKKSIRIPSVKDFAWSPTDHTFAYWFPEKPNVPAQVGLIAIPSRDTVRDKNLHFVKDVKIHWHPKGDFLAFQINRSAKSAAATNVEVFRIRQKNVPVEVLELQETSGLLAWEPTGPRFAISIGNSAVATYKINENKITLGKKMEDKRFNKLLWSPQGNHILLAAVGAEANNSATLEFVNANTGESYGIGEHFMCNGVSWDPSGRFVVSYVAQAIDSSDKWRYASENGYILWNFQGKQLFNVKMDQLYQFLWRPRPKTLLSAQQMQNVKKALRDKYSKEFEKEDEEIRVTQLKGAEKERNIMKQEWLRYREEKQREYAFDTKERAKLRGGLLSDDENDYELAELTLEEEISFQKEVVSEYNPADD